MVWQHFVAMPANASVEGNCKRIALTGKGEVCEEGLRQLFVMSFLFKFNIPDVHIALSIGTGKSAESIAGKPAMIIC